jgi:Tol biopolymer transport system component
VISGSESYGNAVLSPDESSLFYTAAAGADPYSESTSARLMCTLLAGGPQVTLLSGQFGQYGYHCATAPSSICVLRESREKHLIFYSLDPTKGRGPELATLESSAEYAWDLSPDGKNIAIVQRFETAHPFRVVSLATGAVRELALKGWSNIQAAAWSADGNRIYVTARSSSSWAILSVDLQGNVGALLEVPMGQSWLWDPVPSPDGRYLAFVQRVFENNAAMLENF